MKIIDPTYLRTLHDGLVTGSVNKDNASSLPDGLVGVYEEALPSLTNAADRQKFNEFFAVWALLKKEVSAAFTVPLLAGWTEDQVIGYIAQYSKWFNSPVSGMYVLYHERLRAFVLQKISQDHLSRCNHALIQQSSLALQSKSGDEWERYALEHLSTHLLTAAMGSKDASALIALACNTSHWNRQIEISKGFEWSKRMLNDMMLWASKYDDDEVIECALNKVDLYHMEQNDAPRIVELVAQNDIETAFQRIESFGGNDKEGLQRKFILYMLCLMELTLLDSKNKPFRREAIEKLLRHLDENLPVDHSALNWNDIFPSYTMFLMACGWSEFGLDYMIVYKRTNTWETAWLSEKGPFSDSQFKILLECTWGISDESDKCRVLADISTELAKQGKVEEVASAMQEALTFANSISFNWKKSIALKVISAELSKQGKFDEAMTCASGISDDRLKSRALADISTELSKLGKLEEAATAMQEALACARGISNDRISARGVSDDRLKSCALSDISTELFKQGKFYEVASALQEAQTCARGISDDFEKSRALADISSNLSKQGKFDEALICARRISIDRAKSCALSDISTELSKQGEFDLALNCARGISNDYWKSCAMVNIATYLSKQGKVEETSSAMQEALTYATGISDYRAKRSALKDISTELAKLGKIEEAASAMLEALTCARGISNDSEKSNALRSISTKLAKLGKVEEALTCATGISDDRAKRSALKDISTQLAKKGKLEEAASAIQEALTCATGNSRALADISAELAKQSKFDEAATAIQEALTCARGIGDGRLKSRALADISTELSKQGRFDEAASAMQEALICTSGISYDQAKSGALKAISTELSKQGKVEEAASAMQDALTCAKGISDDKWKSSALRAISIELSIQGKFNEALTCAMDISAGILKSSALYAISTKLAKQGRFDEALTCARGIDDWPKSSALRDISNELAKLGKVEEAASTMQEALTCAKGISDDEQKSGELRDISTELAKQGNWVLAENISLEIPQMKEKHSCWKTMSNNSLHELGSQKALHNVQHLQSDEARRHYIQGWVEHVDLTDCSKDLFLSTQHYYQADMNCLQQILQKFALRHLFLDESEPDFNQRLYKSLDIQWAMDIKNNLINPL